MSDDGRGGWPPWSRMPSLKEMAEELGINFNDLVAEIENDTGPRQLAAKYEISQDMAGNLISHFYKYGIGSVMGGD